MPAVSTWALLTTTRVVLSSSRFLPDSVTMTSTRVPGTTNPATPTTSLTFTEMARIPGGIEGGSPAPASSAASFALVNGSFSSTALITPRLITSSIVENEPVTGAVAGHCTSFT